MADKDLAEFRRRMCQAYLDDPTDNGWTKLKAAMRVESLRDQGIAKRDAEIAVEEAIRKYNGEDCNVDPVEDSYFSLTDEGLWVQAWVYVYDFELGWLPEEDAEVKLSHDVETRVAAISDSDIKKLLTTEGGYRNIAEYDPKRLRLAVRQLLTTEDLTEEDLEEYLD